MLIVAVRFTCIKMNCQWVQRGFGEMQTSHLQSKVIEALEKNNKISEEEKDIYSYGIRLLFNSLINIFFTLLISAIFKNLLLGICFLLFYLPLRSCAGGYHAKSEKQCFALSLVMLALVMIGLSIYPEHKYWLFSIILCIGNFTLLLFAPCESLKKPLLNEERRNLKRLVISIIIIEDVIYCLAIFSDHFILLKSVFASICVSASLILIDVLCSFVSRRNGIEEGTNS